MNTARAICFFASSKRVLYSSELITSDLSAFSSTILPFTNWSRTTGKTICFGTTCCGPASSSIMSKISERLISTVSITATVGSPGLISTLAFSRPSFSSPAAGSIALTPMPPSFIIFLPYELAKTKPPKQIVNMDNTITPYRPIKLFNCIICLI